jgi:hypothetical protein
MIELPPPPYGASPAYGYTEAEMRAYGEACARAALEAAAQWCDTEDSSFMEEWPSPGMIAAHIRVLSAPSSPSSSQTRS